MTAIRRSAEQHARRMLAEGAGRRFALGADEALAKVAVDREQLLADLQAAERSVARIGKRWQVVRQFSHRPEQVVSTHRWEWLADLSAYRRTAGHAGETGGFYTVRRADA